MLGLLLIALVLVAMGFIAVQTGPATLVSVGVATQALNGNAGELGFPVAPDRLLILAGLGWLAFTERPQRLRISGVHLMLFITASIGVINAMWADTFRQSAAFFGLLDKFGIVPFALFAVAPLLYYSEVERRRFLIVMSWLGAYLSITAVLEYFDQTALLFPSYIGDPNVGIHFGRARGPFVESVAMGLALVMIAALMYVARNSFRTLVGRRLATVIGVACIVSSVVTLTRAVWLGAVVAMAVLLLLDARGRRYTVFIIPAAVLAGFLVFAFVPGLGDSVSDRAAEQEPLWDRLNTNAAAVEAVKAHPWFGIGWGTFPDKGPDYMYLVDEYPLTGAGIDVHNVPLSHAAELGIFAAAFWLATLLAAVGGALLRGTTPEYRYWRFAGIAIAGAWAGAAMFGPLSYPLANSLLWLVAGIANTPRALLESPKVEEETVQWQDQDG